MFRLIDEVFNYPQIDAEGPTLSWLLIIVYNQCCKKRFTHEMDKIKLVSSVILWVRKMIESTFTYDQVQSYFFVLVLFLK